MSSTKPPIEVRAIDILAEVGADLAFPRHDWHPPVAVDGSHAKAPGCRTNGSWRPSITQLKVATMRPSRHCNDIWPRPRQPNYWVIQIWGNWTSPAKTVHACRNLQWFLHFWYIGVGMGMGVGWDVTAPTWYCILLRYAAMSLGVGMGIWGWFGVGMGMGVGWGGMLPLQHDFTHRPATLCHLGRE